MMGWLRIFKTISIAAVLGLMALMQAATLVGPASLKVKTIADLKGLRVGVPRGAMQDLVLTPLAEGNGINLQRFDDEATELQALIAGQIDIGGTGLLVSRTLNRND